MFGDSCSIYSLDCICADLPLALLDSEKAGFSTSLRFGRNDGALPLRDMLEMERCACRRGASEGRYAGLSALKVEAL